MGFERDAVVTRVRGQGSVVGRNKSGDEFPTVADEDDIFEVWNQLQPVFDRLRSDVLAAGGDDQIFFAVDDPQEPGGINFTYVSRVKPSSFERLCRFLRHLVVPLHDVRAAHENFTVFRNPYLLAAESTANGPDARSIWPVQGDNRGCLR